MRHIPNIISSIRIVMIPFIIWQYSIGNRVAAAVLLGLSGLTDMVDGTLARTFGWTSQLGKILDPIADKLTLLSVCILLVIKLGDYRIFFIILLIKDAGMLILGGYLIKNGMVFDGAKWFGKLSTAGFYLGMVVLWLFNIPHWGIIAILSLITALEVISAIFYVPDYFEYRKQQTKRSV